MNRQTGEDLGRLALRIMVGGLMLFHGFAKLKLGVADGVAGIAALCKAHGLPGFFAYLVYVGEIVAPALVLVGIFTRPAALVMAINMVFAVWLAHPGDFFKLQERGGGYALELHTFYFLGALAIFALGTGRFAVKRGMTRWA